MIIDLSPVLAAAKKVEKKWGTEFWLVNTELYCSKILELNPGWMCSTHSHPIKTETFIVLRGEVFLDLMNGPRLVDENTKLYYSRHVLKPGQSFLLKPNWRHRFSSKDGATILEVSTQHLDSDTVRIEESRQIPE